VLFIIARSSSTKQILAVRKDQPTSFPFSFTISAADAMVAGTAFEGPVDITARLSRTGDAMPGAGDIEGTARDIAVGKKNVTVTLDSVRQ
jgi:cytochrome c-type biogenesis protein CcmH